MYRVEELKIDLDGQQTAQIVFEHEDQAEALRYWTSYASGINDVDPVYEFPADHCNQNLSVKRYYRIIAD